jgi:hypothetical protein
LECGLGLANQCADFHDADDGLAATEFNGVVLRVPAESINKKSGGGGFPHVRRFRSR